MSDDQAHVVLKAGSHAVLDIAAEPELQQLLPARSGLEGYAESARRGGGDDWDAPLDLRVVRPRAINLRELWKLTGQTEPAGIAATLGPRIPILLNHVITPFPVDGKPPASVWGLGYEFVLNDLDANTISVVPDDEVLAVGKVGQTAELGLEIGGKVGIPKESLKQLPESPGVSLTGASLHASTNQSFQFSFQMRITLRKVVGAPVGIGGAQWKLFRQDERLDQAHALFQTLLVPEGTTSFRCTLKTWAKQAGILGTSWKAKYWPYADQDFNVSLAGL